MQQLYLNAQPGAWRKYMNRKQGKLFPKFAQAVLVRDRFTCQYCGFQAREFQEVVNLDQNYENNKLGNLSTACLFCTQCFFIESVGLGDFGGGKIIYLPEMTQNELNSFCHVLFCGIANETIYKETATEIYKLLKLRSQLVDETLGDGLSEPAALGRMIIENQLSSEKARSILKDLRLLPSRERFKKQIDHWAKMALDELFVK